MLRSFSQTGVGRRHAASVLTGLLLSVSCGPAEKEYWTKQDNPPALADELYAADSQHCERYAAQNEGRESDKVRKHRYSKCMSARGGYSPEINQSISRENSSHQDPTALPRDPLHQSNEQRLMMDRECRQQAAATLSSPYPVYVNCMQEKASVLPPAIKPPADLAENDKQDTVKGHTQENIGLQSAARTTGDEHPKIGSAIGRRSTAESGENEKPDSSLAQEIGLGVQSTSRNIGSGFSKIGSALGRPLEAIGRGLQTVFRNIGDEIAKIGSRIGNLFKHLGGKDTRDEDKERKPNKLIAAPPEGDIG